MKNCKENYTKNTGRCGYTPIRNLARDAITLQGQIAVYRAVLWRFFGYCAITSLYVFMKAFKCYNEPLQPGQRCRKVSHEVANLPTPSPL